jgi:hypothetical protein
MIAIAAVDAREFIIPNKLVLVGVLLGLADAALTSPQQPAAAVAQAALRAFVFALVFFLFRAAYRRWRGREGIGLGDVKLAAVGGAWLGLGGRRPCDRYCGPFGARGCTDRCLSRPAHHPNDADTVRTVLRASHLDRVAARGDHC